MRLVDRARLSYRQVNADRGRFRHHQDLRRRPRAQHAAGATSGSTSLTGRTLAPTPSTTRRSATTATTTRARPPPTRCAPATPAPGQRAGRRARASRARRAATAARATAGPTCSATSAWTGPTRAAPHGNVVQTGQTALDRRARQPGTLTLALGFGADRGGRAQAARASLAAASAAPRARYARGWHALPRRAASAAPGAAPTATTYDVVGDDARRARGQDLPRRLRRLADDAVGVGRPGSRSPSGAYHLVWARDLYQIATALLAAGDRAGANRARRLPVRPPAEARRLVPAELDRRRHAALDATCSSTRSRCPIVLAWQLGRTRRARLRRTSRRAADFIARQRARSTPQERWENQGGYSPATIAAEIAGLVCAADIARRNGDNAVRERATGATADDWQRQRRRAGRPRRTARYSPQPVLPAPDQGRQPERGHARTRSATAARRVDQRKVVDPSFLELVRLGVKPRDDPVDPQHDRGRRPAARRGARRTARFWHRYDFDGYGETKDGARGTSAAVNPTEDWANNATIGRNWPIFARRARRVRPAGRRRGGARARSLAHMAAAANDGHMIPEQVWDAGLRRRAVSRASRPARARSRRRRWRGRTPSTCGSRGRSRPAARSSSRRSSRRATRVAEPDAGGARR